VSHSIPFLTLLILLPATGAVVMALLGLDNRLSRDLTNALALLVSLATAVVAVIALITMKVNFGGYQLVSNHTYTGETLGSVGSWGSTGSRSSWCC